MSSFLLVSLITYKLYLGNNYIKEGKHYFLLPMSSKHKNTTFNFSQNIVPEVLYT